MPPPSAHAMLRECFSSSPGVSPRVFSPDEWEALIRRASAERLLPALGSRLCDRGDAIPRDVADFLVAVEDMNRERNERILDDARTIAGLLNQVGIEPVFLKGAAFLVEGVYPEPGLRYLCDLDLLVPASRLGEAAGILEGQGYLRDTSDVLAHFRHHYPQLQRPLDADGAGSAPVELHHSLGHAVSRKLLSGEAMYSRSRLLQWRGVSIRIPSPEDLVTHHILHSQLHHSYRERIWPPLRAMYDLVMLAAHYKNRLDWTKVRQRFRDCGQENVFLLHMRQVNAALRMPEPFAIDLGLAGRMLWMRRQALLRWPVLRFFDPGYLFASALSRRFQFLQSIMSSPGGLRYALGMFFRRGFYSRLAADVMLR